VATKSGESEQTSVLANPSVERKDTKQTVAGGQNAGASWPGCGEKVERKPERESRSHRVAESEKRKARKKL